MWVILGHRRPWSIFSTSIGRQRCTPMLRHFAQCVSGASRLREPIRSWWASCTHCWCLQKPWDSIGMDCVRLFPESNGHNYLWVVIYRMISMVHLILVQTTMKASELSWIYFREIVQLHRLPSMIVSCNSKFTSKW